MDQIQSFLVFYFIDSDIYTTLEEWTIQELEQQLTKLSLPGLTIYNRIAIKKFTVEVLLVI